MNLDASQSAAVATAVAARGVCVLTGGPGTGKTTTCRAILDAWGADGREHIALCAPTGKAARRLSEQTQRQASTIHRLLAYQPGLGFTYGAGAPLSVDALICDEASMLDVELGAALLAAVPNGAAVLFVGDVDQLPPVGPGQVLRDLIASERVPVARLETVHRQRETSQISLNAQRIKRGEMPVEGDDFHFARASTAAEVLKALDELAGAKVAAPPFVLCPQRTTLIGVNALNAALQDSRNPDRGVSWRVGDRSLRPRDPVMQTRNDYERGVMNGEIGAVHGVYPDDSGREALHVDYEGIGRVVYDREAALQLDLAYASTIHKSQGSEYPSVVAVVHSAHSYMLSRSLLYTAVTRGKEQVVVVGDDQGLQRAVSNVRSEARWSGLAQRLRKGGAA